MEVRLSRDLESPWSSVGCLIFVSNRTRWGIRKCRRSRLPCVTNWLTSEPFPRPPSAPLPPNDITHISLEFSIHYLTPSNPQEESTATFEPVVKLEEVEVTSGEEDEEIVFQIRAKVRDDEEERGGPNPN